MMYLIGLTLESDLRKLGRSETFYFDEDVLEIEKSVVNVREYDKT